MRHKILTVAAAGVFGVAGLAAAGPALAATGATDTAAAVSSRVDRVKDALAGLVKDGTLTQDQADKVAGTLQSAGLGHGGGHGGRGGHDLAAAATALGMSEADLRTALDGDKTLAQVAEDKNVSVDALVAALEKAERARIAEAVTAGRLTQAQADERLKDLTARITERVNSARPARPEGGRGGPRGGDGPAPVATPPTS